MATSSRVLSEQSRPYQGYPFVNPVVIDVPTVDAATAAKWANLPRRPIGTPVHKNFSKSLKNNGQSVDIDTTSEAGSSIGSQSGSTRLHGSTQKDEDVPVVYIDIPDEAGNNEGASPSHRENSGMENAGFVQDTIFFDPFENRPIDVNKCKELSDAADVPGSGVSNASSSRPSPVPASSRPHRPNPPRDLDIPASSGGSSMSSPFLPGFMNKESQVYGASGSTEDGFTLTPLPVSDYPEPPPAYSEVAERNNNTSTETPPRTVVVVPEQTPTVGLPSSDRKFAQCQNCGLRVHTIVVKENGVITHIIALITVIFCLLPLTVLLYCSDFCKYRVHYCPNCNHSIGYEIPFLCQNNI